jgi:hypothetical protein
VCAVWRRTLLFPCTGLLLLGSACRLGVFFAHYLFLLRVMGNTTMGILCPYGVVGCAAIGALDCVFWDKLSLDLALLLVAFGASVLCVQACRAWTDYKVSSRFLLRSYFALFLAPFILLLLLPSTQARHGRPRACVSSCLHTPPLECEVRGSLCNDTVHRWAELAKGPL